MESKISSYCRGNDEKLIEKKTPTMHTFYMHKESGLA